VNEVATPVDTRTDTALEATVESATVAASRRVILAVPALTPVSAQYEASNVGSQVHAVP
jgi:hypothetical protein